MKKSNFIVIRHSVLEKITEKDVEETIQANFENVGKFHHIEVKPIDKGSIPHAEINAINWGLAAFRQEEIYEKTIFPILEKYPDYKIIYFGIAPIPLAIHLGFQFGTWKRIEVFLRNHDGKKEWYLQKGEENVTVLENGVPNEDFLGSGDVLLRIASSYKINETETVEAIDPPVIKAIDISVAPLIKDLHSSDNAVAVADVFGNCLDKIVNHLKKVDTIHLIGTVPVGLAFLIGTKISANIFPSIQTYQYFRNASIKYDPVLKINDSLDSFAPLSNEEMKSVESLKETFRGSIWENLQSLIENDANLKPNHDFWYKSILLERPTSNAFNNSRWNQLQYLSETPLRETTFGIKNKIPGGFQFDSDKQSWEIDNHMIYNIYKRLNNDDNKVYRSLRMLLLHEGLHYWLHGLNDATAQDIGRFPKILEEIDYQADVWAMLYEYSFTKLFNRKEIEKEKINQFFGNLIEVAIGTMWSFDDEGINLKNIQIRRLNRYLIWYWQLNQLKNAKDKSLKKVAQILSNPPIIELKGLNTRAEGQRVFYRLNGYERENLEIGILWNNKIIRTGNLGFFRIEDLIDGFIERDSKKISNLIRALCMQVSSVNGF